MHLMPQMAPVWNYEANRLYAERYFRDHGNLTQPDPCAPPVIGRPDLYQISYGPNPLRPGECILDPNLTPGSTFSHFSCQAGKKCGRFPDGDGQYNWGYYNSAIGDEMGDIYGY